MHAVDGGYVVNVFGHADAASVAAPRSLAVVAGVSECLDDRSLKPVAFRLAWAAHRVSGRSKRSSGEWSGQSFDMRVKVTVCSFASSLFRSILYSHLQYLRTLSTLNSFFCFGILSFLVGFGGLVNVFHAKVPVLTKEHGVYGNVFGVLVH